MNRLLLLLLCACTWPDEVGVGVHGSEYDFLGGDGAAPYFSNDRGNDIGVNAWASWQLKPQRMTIVESEKPWQPAPEKPAVVVNTTESKSESTVDIAVKVGETVDAMGAGTKWLIFGSLVVLGILFVVSKAHRWIFSLFRKKKP